MVVDSSIFIEFLRATNKTKTTLFQLPDNCELLISVVTLYELLMGATDNRKKQDIALLTDPLIMLPFSQAVAEKAAEIYHDLRSRNQMIEFRDIFIAATAIVYDIPILSKNEKHFNRINGLQMVNLN